MGKETRIFITASHIFIGAAVLAGLYVSSLYSYLFFHTLVELFSVVTAFIVFALAWNTRRINDNYYLLFIGIASLFTGALDLVHALAYKGMGVFPEFDANPATQFWIAFRFLFSVSFLLAAFFIKRKPPGKTVFALYFAVFLALTASIILGWFPDCYREGTGLTQFKVVSEYAISLIFLASLGLLLLQRRSFDPGVLRLMVLSLICSVAAELSFTQYVSVYGFANMLGHVFLLASVAFVYRAIVVTGLVEPSQLLFRNLKQSEEAIRASENKYRLLFENMINAFAYHRIVADERGKPVDYVFLEVNDAFENMTGLKRAEIIGKSVRQVLPGIESDPGDWIRVYGEVALDGRDVRFEQRAAALNKWFSVLAYSPIREHFVAIFEDITERKRSEEELSWKNREIALANRILEVFVKESGEGMYDKVLDLILKGMYSAYGVFGYIDEQGVLVCPTMSKIFDDCEMEGKCILYPRHKWKGLWGRALLEKKTFYTNEAPAVPGGHVPIRNNIATPILFQNTVIGLFNLANKQAGYTEEDRRFIEAIASRVAPVLYAWIQKEMRESERSRAEAALQAAHDDLEQRVRERTAELAQSNASLELEIAERRETERRVAVTNELLKLYTRKFSRKEYLDVAVELIRDWSGCRHTGIRIADKGGNIPYQSCAGYNPDFLSTENNLSFKDDCICPRIAAGKPGYSELVSTTPNGSFFSNEMLRFVDGLSDEQRLRYRRVCTRFGFRSLAVVPIRHREMILGAIHIADEREGTVPPRNVQFIEQLAFIIGEALFRFGVEEDLSLQREELVRMNEQLRNLTAHVDAVREGERTSIAREIHDELGQVLTAIKMDVSWLRKRMPAAERKLSEKAKETLQIIDSAIQSVKRISVELRPSVLDDIGLAAAIEWAAKDFQKRTGIRCAVSIRPENISVDRMRSTALFRIFQESLTNITLHAKASAVTVSLQESDGMILLAVTDNGKGIRKEEIAASHSFGLIGMRERVQFLGGAVEITGAQNRGTTVAVTLPINPAKPGAGTTASQVSHEGTLS